MDLPIFIRDTREHEGQGFTWRKSTQCAGTIDKKLDTGDYSIVGFEDKFVIERKGSASEIINNLFSQDKERFYKELERLKSFKRCAIICEFSLEDVACQIKKLYKYNKASRANINMDKFCGALASINAQYNIPFFFTGQSSSAYNTKTASRITTNYGKDLARQIIIKMD